jgi:hypothetical protein
MGSEWAGARPARSGAPVTGLLDLQQREQGMPRTIGGKVSAKRRATMRERIWPDDAEYWRGPKDQGYFCGPRSLPLIVRLLNSKSVAGVENLGGVYLELLSRHLGEGLVEMGPEEDHAYAAGYSGQRAVRSWRERMKRLEEYGFIRTERRGSLTYGYVFLVHPAVAVNKFVTAHPTKVKSDWLNAYAAHQVEYQEATAGEVFFRDLG